MATVFLMAAVAPAAHAAQRLRAPLQPLVGVSPRYQFRFKVRVPADAKSIPVDTTYIGQVLDRRLDEFLDACYAQQPAQHCDRIAHHGTATVIYDFVFRCNSFTGLCAGETGRGTHLNMWNTINAMEYSQCAISPLVRTREQMYELAGKNDYWLQHQASWFCGNEQDPIPTLVHELCHAFGPLVGHVPGYADCQSIPRPGIAGGGE